MDTNSQIAAPARTPQELQYIRPTSLRDFDECPDRWRMKYLEGIKGGSGSGAADIGTAVHSIIEMHLRSMSDDSYIFSEETFQQNYLKIPASETAATMNYLEHLNGFVGMQVLGVEVEFEMIMVEDMPPIRGHIDAIIRDVDMNIIIIDHKTNRTSNDETYWSSQIQQQIYALAVSKLYECRSIDFRIGYVNLGYDVQWNITAQDQKRTLERINRLWTQMKAYSDVQLTQDVGSHWPRTISNGCRWCPIKQICSEYNSSLNNFAKSFENKMVAGLTAQLEFVEIVEKLATAKKEELRDRIKENIRQSDSGEFTDGRTTWKIVNKEQRQIKASVLLGLLGMALREELMSIEDYRDHLDVIFSAKVTGTDKLAKSIPVLAVHLESITERVKSTTDTLKAMKNYNMIGGTSVIKLENKDI